ncbi:cytochrome P450 [Gammaproteobacteria bacterium]|nr:cytochrome P450 [Gammaproteobacteria bacterium]
MRILPPVWSMSRTAVQEDEIDGYRIPVGSNLFISPYVTHRRADLWPDPEKFIPERFASGQRDRHPRYAFFPFGGGRHTCLGEPFVRMEALMILAAIQQFFELKIVPGFEVVPQAVVTLRPRDGIRVTLEPREIPLGRNR